MKYYYRINYLKNCKIRQELSWTSYYSQLINSYKNLTLLEVQQRFERTYPGLYVFAIFKTRIPDKKYEKIYLWELVVKFYVLHISKMLWKINYNNKSKTIKIEYNSIPSLIKWFYKTHLRCQIHFIFKFSEEEQNWNLVALGYSNGTISVL